MTHEQQTKASLVFLVERSITNLCGKDSQNKIMSAILPMTQPDSSSIRLMTPTMAKGEPSIRLVARRMRIVNGQPHSSKMGQWAHANNHGETRVHFRVRVQGYSIGDQKKDPNVENYPWCRNDELLVSSRSYSSKRASQKRQRNDKDINPKPQTLFPEDQTLNTQASDIILSATNYNLG